MRLPRTVVGVVATVLCLAVGVVGLGFRKLERQDARIEEVIHLDEVEDEVDAAQRCVTSWETRADIRRSDKAAGQAGAEALIQVTNEIAAARGGEPTPAEFLDRYRAVLDANLDTAGRIIEDPTCGLDEARRILADPQAAEAAVRADGQ